MSKAATAAGPYTPRHTRSRGLATLALVAVLTPTALLKAQSTPLPAPVTQMSLDELMGQEVVVSASRYEQRASEVPAAVSIITAEEIRRFGHRTIQDVLNTVRGYYTTSDRNYSYIGVRGFSPPGDYNARVLVLLDGHRLNENLYDGAYVGNETPFDLSLVERVEVVRGPGASIYGSNAVFGVVNFVTRGGAAMRGTQVNVEGGSLASARVTVTHAASLPRGTDLVASVSGFTTDGQTALRFDEYSEDPATGGVAANVDGDRSRRLYVRASNGPWTITALHSSR